MDRLNKKDVWHDNCQPNVGQLVINDGREYVLIEGIEVHKCENISLIYDKKRSLFFEESVRKLHRIQKMNFDLLIQ